ncbi:MAG: prephenate dehydrogenase/arogenate dehydrogenase family protein [Gaiellales bacterium]
MQVAIVGLGLMGGSLGLALREHAGAEVAGFDLVADEAAVALERGCVDRVAGSIADACADADVVVVATPVSAIGSVIEQVLAATPSATITDIGSTKGHVVATVPDAGRARFVGGHPICGSEAHGAAHARPELFQGATWFLTPSLESDPERLAQIHALVVAIGARPVVIDADAHDSIVAMTSHFPHVLANVLATQVAETDVNGHRPLHSVGGSFRDMTRVAGANADIWIDILLDNREAVLAALGDAQARLDAVATALRAGDEAYLATWIADAGAARGEALAHAHRAAPADLHELLVSVPDRPGAISSIAQTLSAAGINIEEFSLSHISPERGGEIRIIVAGAGNAERAAGLLRADGCDATHQSIVDVRGGAE